MCHEKCLIFSWNVTSYQCNTHISNLWCCEFSKLFLHIMPLWSFLQPLQPPTPAVHEVSMMVREVAGAIICIHSDSNSPCLSSLIPRPCGRPEYEATVYIATALKHLVLVNHIHHSGASLRLSIQVLKSTQNKGTGVLLVFPVEYCHLTKSIIFFFANWRFPISWYMLNWIHLCRSKPSLFCQVNFLNSSYWITNLIHALN